VLDKSPYSPKQVTTFRYKEQAADKIKKILAPLRKFPGEEPEPVEA
jgi:hypothetical protein